MSVTGRIKEVGSVVLGFAALIGIAAIGVGLLTGAAEFSVWVLKWTFPVFSITLICSIVILLPLSLLPPTRGFSAVGFMVASSAFSAILWLWGMAYTYSVWGMFGVIIGLVMMGIGVVPVAIFAALVHGDWSNFWMLISTGFAIIIFRVFANWLAEKADERAYELERHRTPAITTKSKDLNLPE